MASIAFGIGTSHTPMLLASDEILPRFVETDRVIRHRDKDGRPTTYDELLKTADARMAELVAPQRMIARQNAARAAARNLRMAVGAADLDAMIIIADDHDEMYLEDCRAPISVYCGETIRNDAVQPRPNSSRPDWWVKNRQGFFEPEAARHYPVQSELAVHLIESLMERDFDVASSMSLRAGVGEGHAVSYVHRHVMDRDKIVPVVPIFLNTYYPPNQPRPRRCYRLGQAIRNAAEEFPRNSRIGIVASGGLSHFLVDEDFDRSVLQALADKNVDFLQNLPRNKLQAGNSEILNWVTTAGAVEHLALSWFEYVPGYRTPAGTGTGLSFATWTANGE
jgi:hypothetical protein